MPAVDTGTAMRWHFGELIGALAATRTLGAGCVVASLFGPDAGEPQPPALKAGEAARIDLHDTDGRSLFGAIEQPLRLRGDPPA